MNEAIAEGRRLWLSAPDDVVLAYEKLLDIAEGKDTDPQQKALGECIEAMRRDATFSAALFPRFWRTKLGTAGFQATISIKEDAAMSQLAPIVGPAVGFTTTMLDRPSRVWRGSGTIGT